MGGVTSCLPCSLNNASQPIQSANGVMFVVDQVRVWIFIPASLKNLSRSLLSVTSAVVVRSRRTWIPCSRSTKSSYLLVEVWDWNSFSLSDQMTWFCESWTVCQSVLDTVLCRRRIVMISITLTFPFNCRYWYLPPTWPRPWRVLAAPTSTSTWYIYYHSLTLQFRSSIFKGSCWSGAECGHIHQPHHFR